MQNCVDFVDYFRSVYVRDVQFSYYGVRSSRNGEGDPTLPRILHTIICVRVCVCV